MAMAEAARSNREEQSRRAEGFNLTEQVSKLGEYPKRLRQFLHDVRVEMKQVNWPSRQDVWSTTMVVVVTVAFFGVYFAITDSLFSKGSIWLLHYFRK
jgi:preprotein translocase subunit SecE